MRQTRTVRACVRTLRSMSAMMILISALVGVTACGSSTSLATSCSEYLQESKAEQLKLAAQWGSPSQTESVNAAAEAVAPSYREQLLQYCSRPEHASATLKELALTLGP